MPNFRKVNPTQESAPVQRPLSQRARVAQEYDAFLEGFAAGDHGRAEIVAGDRRALVRNRLQAAARRRGLLLRFRPGPGPALIFRVEAAPPRTRATPAAAPAKVAPAKVATLPSDLPVSTRIEPPRTPDLQRPRGVRQPAGRYDEVLPRWMRDAPNSAGGSPRRGTGKRRPH
ncbi:MAG: hypothetical protein IPP13_26375 [Kouleothrix sp.]|jgi:hypothetical protein|nr:hypothetical protein [Kouleothrix sp.]